MTHVVKARARFEKAQEAAKQLIDEARADFGLSIKEARDRDGVSQLEIAKGLGLTREQVRRYQRFYEDWASKNAKAD